MQYFVYVGCKRLLGAPGQASASQCRLNTRRHPREIVSRNFSGAKFAKEGDNADYSAIQSLPLHFLRDSDPNNFDASTQQRTDAAFNLDDGKPILSRKSHDRYAAQRYRMDGTDYLIDWGDGVTSRYSRSWIEQTLARRNHSAIVHESKTLWSGLSEDDLRQSNSMSIAFDEIILGEKGVIKSLKSIYRHGILLVTGTPTGDGGAGVAALASAVSGGSNKILPSTSLLANYRRGGRETLLPNGTEGPLRTLYGSVWFTSSSAQMKGTSTADSAYGQGGLPLHTDMTYHRDPPGLQVFTMIQPALEGGESVFGDGFAAAKRLLDEDPGAFETLSSIVRTYRCGDRETGWDLQGQGPVIQLKNGQLSCIRHNDLDRLPDLAPPVAAGDFYDRLVHAHQRWDAILAQDEIRLVLKLQPGDTVVVANQVSCLKPSLAFQCFWLIWIC
jgi:Taurine catabolism dioxygenase TauD, TfdA family